MNQFILFITLLAALPVCRAMNESDSSSVIKSSKSVCYTAQMKDGEIHKGKRGWYKWFLDDEFNGYSRQGERVETREYDAVGKEKSSTHFIYSKTGNLVQLIDSLYLSSKKKKLDSYTSFYFDKMDFCYLDSSFSANNEVQLITLSVKDYKKNIEFSKTVYPDGTVLFIDVSYYDTDNEILKTEDRGENNEILSTTYFFHDSSLGTSEYYRVEEDDTVSFVHSTFDEQGLLVHESYFFERYAEENEELELQKDKAEFWFKYEYNEAGHWIKKLVFRDDELLFVEEREIEYWD
jgi:hypothetical protein